MTQQEIEKAIGRIKSWIFFKEKEGVSFDKEGFKDLQLILSIAKLHLLVMKSGMPKKKLTYQNRSIKIGGQEIKETDCRYNVGYNDGIDDFTAYLAQKLSGLEEVIYKNSEDNGGCGVVINPKQLLKNGGINEYAFNIMFLFFFCGRIFGV